MTTEAMYQMWGTDADRHFATIANQELGSMVQMGHHYRE